MLNEKSKTAIAKKIAKVFTDTVGDLTAEDGRERFIRELADSLLEELRSAARELLGYDLRWHEVEIKRDSPLESALAPLIAKEALKEADKIFKERPRLTPTQLKQIHAQARSAYVDRVQELARERARELAETHVEAQFKEFLKDLK